VPKIDLLPLLKISARLLDLHDSKRTLGESTQYQTEDRRGHGDGIYLAIAGEVLEVLQEHGKRSGEEFSSCEAVTQAVRDRIEWARDPDIEYVLNVLSRPSELKFMHSEDGGESHVIGDKETNLVEKAAHIVAFRLSRVGRTALAIAMDNMDITYIEGDVTKLIRAIESGRLTHALGFIERMVDQLRYEQLALISLIERTAGGRRLGQETIVELEIHRETMRRTVELVETAKSRVDEIIRLEVQLTDSVPIGMIKSRVQELAGGIVRYGRELSRFAEQALKVSSSTVRAPSFMDLAKKWVKEVPAKNQVDTVLAVLGPSFPVGMIPMGSDFAGIVRARVEKSQAIMQIDLETFDQPLEEKLADWIEANLEKLRNRLDSGSLMLEQALLEELADTAGNNFFGCLVAALTSPEEWAGGDIEGILSQTLTVAKANEVDVMFSHLELRKRDDRHEESVDDTL